MNPKITSTSMESLQRKYAAEAAKRHRPEGLAQFVTLQDSSTERLCSLTEDLWIDHDALNATDPALEDGATYKFLILGAGYGGLLHAVRLIQAGLADCINGIRLVDTAGGFGGAWYWNRYPGLHCDVESYSYMPLLEETGYMPKKKYDSGTELRAHAERIADMWHLRDKTLFRANIKTAQWDAATKLWGIEIEEQRRSRHGTDLSHITVYARYFLITGGIHTRPQVPRLPGLESFTGPMFHTARWDYSITGGSPDDPKLTGLQGKRVGILGTGATAVQVVPHLAQWASELYVFQRTPSAIHELGQKETDQRKWTTKIAKCEGWQMERMVNFNRFPSNGAQSYVTADNIVNDSWSKMPAFSALIGGPAWGVVEPTGKGIEEHINKLHQLDRPRSEAAHAHVDTIVKDASTADKLKAWYPVWCKRPAFSDSYLQVFNQSHVHLVDTNGKGVSSVTKDGLVSEGHEYQLDVLVLSTGYRTPVYANGCPATRAGIKVFGRDGLSLDKKWLDQGVATLHGMYTHGFPNLFFVGHAQSGAAANFVMVLDVMARHIAYVIKQAQLRVGTSSPDVVIEVERDAEERWTGECMK
ncbi:hypothetical protein FOPG_18459 [Fusarium oxysporum f. sp. conglutinans race 2 54008]|nr:hypothetical protein FOPG_18459 [Fusarium oxysporum f. sp. conglutinans race 2 54008]